MSKAKVGDKYVIEIDEIIKGGCTGNNQYRVKGFDKVFFDDKGLSILEKYNSEEYFDGYDFGINVAWTLANNIMEIPIKERAKLFNCSLNKVSFVEICKKHSINEIMSIYNTYHNKKYKKNLQQELTDFINSNDCSLTDVKNVLEELIKEGK